MPARSTSTATESSRPSSEHFSWDAEAGMGMDQTEVPLDLYSSDYWSEYRKRDATPTGARLTLERIRFVKRNVGAEEVVDIGIGGGRFVTERGGLTFGFDVSEPAVKWLKSNQRFWNPYRHKPQNITCWDSLEHLKNPAMLIDRVDEHVFVSMPIYKDAADCLASKHFKPGEHLWYFTDWGLEEWFHERGFALMERNKMETECGREGIESFLFRRVD